MFFQGCGHVFNAPYKTQPPSHPICRARPRFEIGHELNNLLFKNYLFFIKKIWSGVVSSLVKCFPW